MVVFPNSKINLGLQILEKRPDGFHDIRTVFYPVSLQDGLEIIHQPETADVVLTLSGLPIEPVTIHNICFRAWQLLKKDFPALPGIALHLHKVIPMGAGLGGGSADGSFTLMALNKKFGLSLSREDLEKYALELGSDCPFFIRNSPCLAEGRGERLKEIDLDLSSYRIVLVYPRIHVSTSRAFSLIRPSKERPSLEHIIRKDVSEWKDVLHNDFEEVVFALHPEILEIKKRMYAAGAVYASLSGSGSTVFGLFSRDAMTELNLPADYFIRHI